MTRFTISTGCFFLFIILSAALAVEPLKKGTEADLAPASYQIRNKQFSELLRPEDANSAEGIRIVLYPGQPWKCMTWKLSQSAPSNFVLQNHFTSKTFAPVVSEKAEQAVQQVSLAKGAGERPTWNFIKLADGSYKITDAKSGKALSAVKNGGTAVIVIAPWEDKAEQKWEVLKIDPKQLTM